MYHLIVLYIFDPSTHIYNTIALKINLFIIYLMEPWSTNDILHYNDSTYNLIF